MHQPAKKRHSDTSSLSLLQQRVSEMPGDGTPTPNPLTGMSVDELCKQLHRLRERMKAVEAGLRQLILSERATPDPGLPR